MSTFVLLICLGCCLGSILGFKSCTTIITVIGGLVIAPLLLLYVVHYYHEGKYVTAGSDLFLAIINLYYFVAWLRKPKMK